MSHNLYRRQGARIRALLIGAAISALGAALAHFDTKGAYVVIAVGVVALGVAVVRGRRPLVSVDAQRLTLRFRELVDVPLHQIERVVDPSKAHAEIQLVMFGGGKHVIPLASLEDDDVVWLRRELKNALRSSQRLRAGP